MATTEDTLAEKAWERFDRHCRRCTTCCATGGEWAPDEDLCLTGQGLAAQWGAAEENTAEVPTWEE